VSIVDQVDAWYEARPPWVRLPLYAAGVAGAWGLFIGLAGLLNTLDTPRTTLGGAFLSSLWLALHGALGGATYALLWPRLAPRGGVARLAAGALTAIAALIPSVVVALRTLGSDLLTSSWFWSVFLAAVAVGALIISRPWQRRRPPVLARIRQKAPPSARDYGLEVGAPTPPPDVHDQPHN